jgi:hypothetical protein
MADYLINVLIAIIILYSERHKTLIDMKPQFAYLFFILLIVCNLTAFAQTRSLEMDDRNADFVIDDNGLPYPMNSKEWWETGNSPGNNYVIHNKVLNADFIATRTDFTISRSDGFVGVGVPDPSAQLHTVGTVRFQNFGAGTMQTDANGNISVASDERLKDIIGPYQKGLNEILAIDPIQFYWKEGTGMDRHNIYTGFSAQDVQDVLPEAVGKDDRGYLSLSDRSILAALVNAVKELKLENDVLRSEIAELRMNDRVQCQVFGNDLV